MKTKLGVSTDKSAAKGREKTEMTSVGSSEGLHYLSSYVMSNYYD